MLISDHCLVSCRLHLPVRKAEKILLTSRNVKGIDRAVFRTDLVSAFSDVTDSDDPAQLVDNYNAVMTDLLNKHAPRVSRCVSSRPRAPWHDVSITTAKQERRKAERKWRKTGLEIHRQIYQQRKKDVRKKVLELKREHINYKICMSTTSKELFKISSDLMGTSGSSPAPDLPKHELPDAFADFL